MSAEESSQQLHYKVMNSILISIFFFGAFSWAINKQKFFLGLVIKH